MALGFNFGSGGFGFTQSSTAGQGITETKRIETASVVVAVDESGDFNSIQEAIDSLNGEGGFIQVKEGTYIIKETLLVNANITLNGVGQKSLLLASGIDTIMEILGDDVTIQNLGFEGEDTSDNGILIQTTTKEDVLIKDCNFKEFGKALNILKAFAFIIESNKFEETDIGIYIANSSVGVINGNLFNYNTDGTTMIESGGSFEQTSITGNSGFGSEGFQGATGDFKLVITGNNFSEDGDILIHGSYCLFIGNISNTITDSGTGSLIANNG